MTSKLLVGAVLAAIGSSAFADHMGPSASARAAG